MSGNSFMRNIVRYLDPVAPLYGIYNGIDLSTTKSDYNIIHHEGLPLLVPYTRTVADGQWRAWQKMGFDRHSIVADPLFRDIGKGDYTLLPGSPAFKVGFKAIPIDKIGIDLGVQVGGYSRGAASSR
jgi:hypothetical protein